MARRAILKLSMQFSKSSALRKFRKIPVFTLLSAATWRTRDWSKLHPVQYIRVSWSKPLCPAQTGQGDTQVTGTLLMPFTMALSCYLARVILNYFESFKMTTLHRIHLIETSTLTQEIQCKQGHCRAWPLHSDWTNVLSGYVYNYSATAICSTASRMQAASPDHHERKGLIKLFLRTAIQCLLTLILRAGIV